jgi:hypothetical protein
MHLLNACDGTIQIQKRPTDVNIFLFRFELEIFFKAWLEKSVLQLAKKAIALTGDNPEIPRSPLY